MRMLDPGGGGGDDDDGSSSTSDAADELTRRDRGSTESDDGGGGIDAGRVTDIVNEDTGGGGDGGGGGGGSAADELSRRDPGGGSSSGSSGGDGSPSGPSSGDDRSTDRGVTSGGGETTDSAPDDSGDDSSGSDPADELTDRDQGSSPPSPDSSDARSRDPGITSGGGERTQSPPTDPTPGVPSGAETGPADDTPQRSGPSVGFDPGSRAGRDAINAAVAADSADISTQGVESETGRTAQQARQFEQRLVQEGVQIQTEDGTRRIDIQDASEIAIEERNGELVPVFTDAFRTRRRRELAEEEAEAIAANDPAIDEEDVEATVGDDGVEFGVAESARLRAARDTFEEDFEAGEAFTTDGSEAPMASDRGLYETASEQRADRLQEQFDAEDFQFNVDDDGEISIGLSEAAQRSSLRTEVASQNEWVEEDDVVLESTDDGLSARVSDEALRTRFAEQQDVDPDEVQVTREGDTYVASLQPDSEDREEDPGLLSLDIDTDSSQLLRMPENRDRPPIEADVESSLTVPDAPTQDEVTGTASSVWEAYLAGEYFDAGALSSGSSEEVSEGMGEMDVDTPSGEEVADGVTSATRSLFVFEYDGDTNVQYVDPRAAELATEGTAAAVEGTSTAVEEATSGDYFAPGATSPGSPEEVSEGMGDPDVDVPSGREAAEGAGRGVAGGIRALMEVEYEGDTNVQYADPDAAEAAIDTAEGVWNGAFFDPGAMSPSEEGGEATGRAASQTQADAEEAIEENADFTPDEGVEAAPRELPEGLSTAGGAAVGARAGGGANPVSLLVRRSPVGAPSRTAARRAAVVVAGTGLAAGGAAAIQSVRDSRNEPTAETRAELEIGSGFTATEVGLGERTSATEIGLGERTTATEVGLGKRISATEVGLGERVTATQVGLPTEGGTGTGAGSERTPGDSLVPSEYPLPGRDIPRNPREESAAEVDPTDYIDTGVQASPVQQNQEEEPLSDLLRDFEETQQRRRRERARAREDQLLSSGQVRSRRESARDRVRRRAREEYEQRNQPLYERAFPTGLGAVVGRSATESDLPTSESTPVLSEFLTGLRSGVRPSDRVGPLGAIDQRQRQAQQQGQALRQRQRITSRLEQSLAMDQAQQTALEVATEPAVEMETMPEYAYEYEYGQAQGQGYGLSVGTSTSTRTGLGRSFSLDTESSDDRSDRGLFETDGVFESGIGDLDDIFGLDDEDGLF